MSQIPTSEVRKILGVSGKSVQRYIADGKLHPTLGRNEAGLRTNFFDEAEVRALKDSHGQTSTTSKTPAGQTSPLLSETVSVLKEQLAMKDTQMERMQNTMDHMIERDRERNVLMKGLQDQLLLSGQVSHPGQSQSPTGAAPVPTTGGQTDSQGQPFITWSWGRKHLPWLFRNIS